MRLRHPHHRVQCRSSVAELRASGAARHPAGAAWHPQLAPRGIHSWRRGGPIASLTHATRPPPLRSAAHPVVRGGGADRLTVPCDQDGNGFADDVRAPLGWQREAHAFWWRREQARHGRLCARKAVRVLRGLRAVPLDLHGAPLCTGRIADPSRPARWQTVRAITIPTQRRRLDPQVSGGKRRVHPA